MATKLDISQLDFDGIKDNLKTFLKQQDEFTDYDFEGSGMNILLDVLDEYNTHYLGSMFLTCWQMKCILIVGRSKIKCCVFSKTSGLCA